MLSQQRAQRDLVHENRGNQTPRREPADRHEASCATRRAVSEVRSASACARLRRGDPTRRRGLPIAAASPARRRRPPGGLGRSLRFAENAESQSAAPGPGAAVRCNSTSSSSRHRPQSNSTAIAPAAGGTGSASARLAGAATVASHWQSQCHPAQGEWPELRRLPTPASAGRRQGLGHRPIAAENGDQAALGDTGRAGRACRSASASRRSSSVAVGGSAHGEHSPAASRRSSRAARAGH